MISICIPTYNSPTTFDRLLKSIFSQTYDNFEVVVSDDSSNQDILHVVEQYHDDRLIYIHNEPSLGTPENWNNAIRHASGEYIKIMHHDDWFEANDALEMMIDAIDQTGADFVFCQSAGTPPHKPSQDEVEIYMNNRLPYLLSGNVIGAPSATMYRRTTLEYDPKIKYFVDVDFYINYLTHHTIHYIPEELIRIGTTPVRVTDAIVHDREFIYNEFQYSFLKQWNANVWSCDVLLDVFGNYLRENPDFGAYSVAGLLPKQRWMLLHYSCSTFVKKMKRKLKQLIR